MRLAPKDPRTASEGSSSEAETQPRAGTEQTLLFTHAEATISTEARQQKLKEARENLSVQVRLRKEGSVTDKDVPCPVQEKVEEREAAHALASVTSAVVDMADEDENADEPIWQLTDGVDVSQEGEDQMEEEGDVVAALLELAQWESNV